MTLRRELILIGTLAAVNYGYFQMPAAWNQTSRFDLVRAIVEDGSFRIDPYHENTGDKSFAGGHYYSDKAPGASFLAVPAYALFVVYLDLAGRDRPRQRHEAGGDGVEVDRSFLDGLYVSSLFSVGLVSVLGLCAFHVAARWLAVDREAAWLATLAYGFGSLAFPYATLFYGHQLCASLLLLAFVLVLRARRRAPCASRLTVVLAGALTGAAVVVEYPALVAALVLLAHAGSALGLRRARAFVAGAAPPALLLAVYHTVCFGAPWSTGYASVSDPEFASGMSQGLMGITWPRVGVLAEILFGSYRGLAFLCPVVLLGVLPLARMLRSRDPSLRSQGFVVLAMVGWFLLLNASYYMWWGGSALGPRHAIPMLPFLALPLARWPSGRWRWIPFGLLAYSMSTMLVCTAVGPEPPEGFAPLVAFHWEHFLADRVAVNAGSSNAGLELGLSGAASLFPLLAFWAALVPRLERLQRGGPSGAGAR